MLERVIAFAALVALAGCGVSDLDAVEEADDTVDVASIEAALSTELADETGSGSATDAQLAQSASTRVSGAMTPPACVSTVTQLNTVTYTFTDCTGRYGLAKLTGQVKVVYTRAAGGGTQAVITGTGLSASGATFSISATVVVTTSGPMRTATVTTSSSGTGSRGRAGSRTGTYVVSYDSAGECITLDGTWAAGRGATTTVAGYRRCSGTCPAAGGSITFTEAGGATTTISYDGSAVASWSLTGARGARSGTVNLMCTPG